MWRDEPEDVKAAYKKRSEEQSLKHRVEFPGYKFKPRKCIAKRRKRGDKDGKGKDGEGSDGGDQNEGDGEEDKKHEGGEEVTALSYGSDPSAPASPDLAWVGGQQILDPNFASFLTGLDTSMFAKVAGFGFPGEEDEGWIGVGNMEGDGRLLIADANAEGEEDAVGELEGN
ncbi:hypothetical protein HK097_002734 [Rhizophlyctis rosea]|uniref:HMG box domain-containing protein n=1 Tax=Rhizophlyctis rosea TaxID=64517 RepID=A0AAD5WXM1_9FUNG|nr:hypothetical protein HK097_002734 [Rhizophlyctis rosea]